MGLLPAVVLSLLRCFRMVILYYFALSNDEDEDN